MLVIYRKELRSYFTNMTGIIFAAFLLLVNGIYTVVYNLNGGYPQYEYTLSIIEFVFLILIPILTMRSLADERSRKTDQLLYSLPVKMSGIIVGKYLAMVTVFTIPMILMALVPLILSIFGTVNFATAYSSVFAFWLMGSALIAIGMFCSSLTESVIISAVLSLGALIFCFLAGGIASMIPSSAVASFVCFSALAVIAALICYMMTENSTISGVLFAVIELVLLVVYLINASLFEGAFPALVSSLDVFDRVSGFREGIFDLTGVLYYLSVIFLFVFFTEKNMEKRRWS